MAEVYKKRVLSFPLHHPNVDVTNVLPLQGRESGEGIVSRGIALYQVPPEQGVPAHPPDKVVTKCHSIALYVETLSDLICSVTFGHCKENERSQNWS